MHNLDVQGSQTELSIEELSRQVGAELKRQGKTLAVAESLTAGKLQDAIASVSGSSAYFRGGVTAYHIDMKVEVLGVDRDLAEACNCVSEGVAYQMAVGVRKLMSADLGISTTGYAEPWGDVSEPYAFFFVSLGTAGGQGMVKGEPGFTREQMRQHVAHTALEMAAMMLGALSSDEEG